MRSTTHIRTFTAFVTLTVPALAAAQAPDPNLAGLSVSRTSLEARDYSGGDLDSSIPWTRKLTVTSGHTLYFRWKSSQQGVASARWEVTNSAGGFSSSAVIIASGPVTNTPATGQSSEFSIDFKPILPASPPGSPKDYHVRIVPRAGRRTFAPSLAVRVTYAKPGAQPVIMDFDIGRFETNLRARLDGKVTGYAYAIYQFDSLTRSGSGGHAVLPATLHSADKRVTTLSMSKTVTAAAVMKAMEQLRAKGVAITIDSTISRYLPSNWTRGRHVREITFRRLLTHKSGLRKAEIIPGSGDFDSFANLRLSIERGATDSAFASPTLFYENVNFCLFRVIIPYMMLDRAVLQAAEADSELLAILTAQNYVTYVRKNVLEPIGLGAIDVIPTGTPPYTRYYKFGDPLVFFSDPVDATAMLRSGAGYWNMSAKEYGMFITSLRHHGKIISSASMKLMRDNELGMYKMSSLTGESWEHNGDVTNGAGAGSVGAWIAFSNGVTAVYFANSQGGLAEPPQEVIRQAFNLSW